MTTVRMPNGSLLGGPDRAMRPLLVQGARVLDPRPRPLIKVPMERKVRVLAVVHGWFPHLTAGSERMMQHLLNALPKDEFDIEVLSFGFGETEPTDEVEYEYEGLRVTRGFQPPNDPDLIFVHHEYSARWANSINVPSVLVHHNERFGIEDLKLSNPNLNVFNTQWVKDSMRMPGIVVRPPIEVERHKVESTGNKVTLVNLNEAKGRNTFLHLAESLPEYEFLGVTGGHGDQLRSEDVDLPNVEIILPTQDMREVWSQSRIVLMPSIYESWGMVATEAAINGIPVVCSPTPGLIENLGDAGLYFEQSDFKGYTETVKSLMTNDEFFKSQSDKVRARGEELVLQTEKELRKFVSRVRRLVR